MGNCYQKGKERGPWYEIKATRDVIISRESRGEDASFERELLKSWSKYKGYKGAKKALQTIPSKATKSKSSGTSPQP